MSQVSQSEDQVITSEVDVAVDQTTAFTAFTEELDLWWVRGPINFHGPGQCIAMRMEPRVGGRLLEVYDDATGDAFEIGRITVWEPVSRVGWESSNDDVTTEVRFTPVDGRTRVTVEARIPVGGVDKGGTSWTRVVKPWFRAWCQKRDRVPHEQIDIARLAMGVSYARPAAAAHWLEDVFGFESVDELPEGPDPLPEGEYGPPWIEFHVGNASIMIFKLDGDAASNGAVPSSKPTAVHMPWIYVDDLEAHLAHAKERGAKIVKSHPWPWLASYVAEDIEGNQWTIVQGRPTMR